MHLRQPGFTYSDSGTFTKNKERIQKFKETGDSRYIYQNEINKVCFQHDMTYGDVKDLTRKTASNKHDKAFAIDKNPKYDRYKGGLTSIVYIFFNKKTLCGAITRHRSKTLATQDKSAIKSENMRNQKLAEELKNCTNQLLENLKIKKYIHLLKTKFVVLV